MISNKIAAIGMMNNPSQNTGDVNNSVCIPVNTAAIGIDGQKLLKMKKKRKIFSSKIAQFESIKSNQIKLPINYDEYEPQKD